MHDPVIARFLSPDPVREFHSPYVGMGNDPVNLVDPTGGLTGDPEPIFGKGCNCIGIANGPYSSIDSDGNIFSVLPTLDFTYSENSKLSVSDLFFEWARGYNVNGETQNLRLFVNDNWADSFKDADVVGQARSYFYQKAARLGYTQGLTVTNFAGKKDFFER